MEHYIYIYLRIYIFHGINKTAMLLFKNKQPNNHHQQQKPKYQQCNNLNISICACLFLWGRQDWHCRFSPSTPAIVKGEILFYFLLWKMSVSGARQVVTTRSFVDCFSSVIDFKILVISHQALAETGSRSHLSHLCKRTLRIPGAHVSVLDRICIMCASSRVVVPH